MFGRRFTDMTRFMVLLEANDVQTNLAYYWMHLKEGLQIYQINPTSKHTCLLGQIKSLDLRHETRDSRESLFGTPVRNYHEQWNWIIMSTKEIRIFIAAAVHNVIHLTLNRLCSSKYKLHKYQQGCMPCPEKCILFPNIYRKNQLCVRLTFKQRAIRLQKWISDSFVVKAC